MNSINLNLFKLLFILCIQLIYSLVQCQSLIATSSIDFVYSPFYQQKYDITNPQGASTKIKVADKANLVFISAGFGGVIIIDGATNQIIFVQEAQEFLFTIEATSDGEYVMISYQAKFSVFKFTNKSTLTLMSQADFPTSIMDMFINASETTVYAVGLNGQLVAYDIRNKHSVQAIGFYNSESNIIHQGAISKDGNWILLGNDILGMSVLQVTINPQDNSQEFVLAGQGLMIWKTWAAVITDDNQYVYGLDNWNGLFIYEFNQILSATPAQYPIAITFIYYWPFSSINPSVYSLKLTKDNNYLLIGVRSQGVYIFNIKNRISPVFYQGIQVGAHAFSVNLSPNEEYLYFANAISIYIFEKTEPNLNNNYPNLFNIHQIAVQSTSPAFYKWRCFTRQIQDKNYFFGSFDVGGFGIFDNTNPYNFIEVYSTQYETISLVDSMAISNDNQFLYVPIQENNTSFLMLNLQNISNPTVASYMNMTNPNHNEAVFFSKDYKYFISSYDNGILLIDSSNPPHLNLLCYWEILPYMTGENAGVMITNDNKYVIGAVRGYGIYVLDASDKTNLVFKKSLQTLGAEGIIPSYVNNTYAFLFDGFKGVAIIDLSVLPDLQILSRVSLQGWSNFVIPIQNDQYMLVAQMEAGMMSLVDISDITNPRILSSYQYQTQTAQSICMSPDSQYTFINNNLGTIVLPMNSKVSIHTEIQLIQTSGDGEQTLITLSKNQNLLVGQSIQFNFVPLYPMEGMSILSVSYYEEQQIKPLPFWMNYDSNKRNLHLQVDKTGLNTNNVTLPNLNTVLLQVAVPLNPSSFLYSYSDVQTNSTQAQTIFNYVQQMQYIDSDGLITSLFDPYENLQFSLSGINCTQRLLSVVQLTLQQASYINPVLFYVQPSLSINIANLTAPISTLASTIDFYLTVDASQGKFVMVAFPGVIASTTDAQNQLKFEGSLTNLNKVLSEKIIFANTTSIEGMNVTLTLIDGVNYQVNQVNLISDCAFIKLKLQIHNNPLLSLQSQFNAQYAGGQIDIQQEFSIEFSSQTFVVKDISTINYTPYILDGGNYIEISPDFWIQTQVSSGSITFHGTPPVSALDQIFHMKVVASDGYTTTSDTFTINASGLPFLYVFNLLIKIFGPIFAILGVYKYKSLILNSIYRNVIMFSPDTAVRGQMFKRKITILGDEMEKSKLLYSIFLEKFYSDRAKFREETQFVKNQLQRYGSEVGIEDNEEEQPPSLLQDPTQRKAQYKQCTSQRQSKEKDIQSKQSKKVGEDNNFGDYSRPRRLKVLRGSILQDNIKLQNSIQIIMMSPKNNRQTALEKEYLKRDGSVSLSKVLRDITYKNISFTLTGRRYTAKNFLTDFKNPDSRIYKGLKALFSRYFLKLDVRSFEVYNYMKYYSQTHLSYLKNDWYKGLVNINATDQKDCYGFPVPFPELSLNEDQINLILIDLQVHNQIGQKFETLGDLDINYNLIREVLFADTLGLVEDTPSIFSPCVGESIHLFSYEIESVEAFKKVSNAWCMGIRRLLNFHYMNYGMSKNMTLPNWIQFDQKNGVITMQGIPQSQDVEDLLIKIIDIDQYVIKQYHFKVVDEYFNVEDQENQICDTIADDQSIQLSQNIGKKGKIQNSPKPNGFDSSSQMMNKLNLNSETNYSIFKKQVYAKTNDFSLADYSQYYNKNELIDGERVSPSNRSPRSKRVTSEIQYLEKKQKEQNQDRDQNNAKDFQQNVQIAMAHQYSIESSMNFDISKPRTNSILAQLEQKENFSQRLLNMNNTMQQSNCTSMTQEETTRRDNETSRQLIRNELELNTYQELNVSVEQSKQRRPSHFKEILSTRAAQESDIVDTPQEEKENVQDDEEEDNQESRKSFNNEFVSNLNNQMYFSQNQKLEQQQIQKEQQE